MFLATIQSFAKTHWSLKTKSKTKKEERRKKQKKRRKRHSRLTHPIIF